MHSPLRVVNSRGVRRDAEWGCGVFSLHFSCGEQIYLIARQMAVYNDDVPQISEHGRAYPWPRLRDPEKDRPVNVAGRCRAASSTAARKNRTWWPTFGFESRASGQGGSTNSAPRRETTSHLAAGRSYFLMQISRSSLYDTPQSNANSSRDDESSKFLYPQVPSLRPGMIGTAEVIDGIEYRMSH